MTDMKQSTTITCKIDTKLRRKSTSLTVECPDCDNIIDLKYDLYWYRVLIDKDVDPEKWLKTSEICTCGKVINAEWTYTENPK